MSLESNGISRRTALKAVGATLGDLEKGRADYHRMVVVGAALFQVDRPFVHFENPDI